MSAPFMASLDPERKERICRMAAALDEAGMKSTRLVTILMGGALLSVTPDWMWRCTGDDPTYAIAFCLEFELLSTAYVSAEEALFIGGPNSDPNLSANPEVMFSIYGPPSATGKPLSGEFFHPLARA
jgi:hypothetical protein